MGLLSWIVVGGIGGWVASLLVSWWAPAEGSRRLLLRGFTVSWPDPLYVPYRQQWPKTRDTAERSAARRCLSLPARSVRSRLLLNMSKVSSSK